MTNVLKGIDAFVANINRGLDEAKIDRTLLSEMDHVCYRVETDERYNELRRELLRATRLVTPVGEPAIVNGRPIATFEFVEPVIADGWNISYLELPSPKEGSPYEEGLEHAEFVVLGGNLKRFRAKHPHLEPFFQTGGMNKALNPELGLKDFDMSVKFHTLALGAVVRIEQGIGNDNHPITGNHVTL